MIDRSIERVNGLASLPVCQSCLLRAGMVFNLKVVHPMSLARHTFCLKHISRAVETLKSLRRCDGLVVNNGVPRQLQQSLGP